MNRDNYLLGVFFQIFGSFTENDTLGKYLDIIRLFFADMPIYSVIDKSKQIFAMSFFKSLGKSA